MDSLVSGITYWSSLAQHGMGHGAWCGKCGRSNKATMWQLDVAHFVGMCVRKSYPRLCVFFFSLFSFENVTAVLFVAAISEYNQVLYEVRAACCCCIQTHTARCSCFWHILSIVKWFCLSWPLCHAVCSMLHAPCLMRVLVLMVDVWCVMFSPST